MTRRPELPPVHGAVICVAAPCLVISPEHGQLTGQGIDGIYRSGRRLLSRCVLRVGGRDPVAVQGRSLGADRAAFTATVRTGAEPGPDPDIGVERIRHADGTERITLRSFTARPVRLPVELLLGSDLAELAAVAAGRAGPELPAGVYAAGLRWSTGEAQAVTTAHPAPDDAVASAGLLRWQLELGPGESRTIELRTTQDRVVRATAGQVANPLADARAEGDDPRVEAWFRTSVEDLRALLSRDPEQPGDTFAAAGAPWRLGLAPAESLWAARMALPLGTGLAAATLRILARTRTEGRGAEAGMIPGPLRGAGPQLPPACTGTEATLAFPAVLAEARLWGLPEDEVARLLPTAERCLDWLRGAFGEDGFVADPDPGPRRCETQAHAHRAAVLGADLLAGCGRPGAEEWRERAAVLRERFRDRFWIDGPDGGRPASALHPDGRPLPRLTGAAAHLLDTGLLSGGRLAPGLLDRVRTEQLARLFGAPAMDCGWGLRSMARAEPGHNPYGHRSGAVRAYESAVAVSGLAAAGFEKEAAGLLRGLMDAAEAFGYRLPEMFAADQRTTGSVPVPHPAACRPAAVAAAAGVHVLTALAGIRPDAPSGTVALVPLPGAPLGAIRLAGLRVSGEPFAVRVSRLGLAMVEEAADALQLGV
ncbi:MULTISPECIES: glycogen debranching N-terminal domain-containing protein [Streptomyces]|uniref:glycogen debranching N-terminal domain-containing protein n=1 Tax=Streptomyces TaxID=1883 RepID=UPI0006AED8F8|nr:MULTISPECIES: glycogen debranching N-terminal domain-containing protein [unclassified Streptomyces]KOV02321.1 glycogen debranching protein [Streptomyces sp. XY511]QNE24869.1 glycogen debranching protein [Streptomyces sp. INR7]